MDKSATVDTIRQLLELGSDLMLEDRYGKSATEYATENSNGELLDILENYDSQSRW